MHDEHLGPFAAKLGPGQSPHDSSQTDLPEPGAAYRAYAHPANKALLSLHLLLGKDGIRSFQYVHLDSGSSFGPAGDGQAFVLRFAGLAPARVTIRGRDLWRLYDYIHQHRVSWIMRADRGLSADGETIITDIDIVEGEKALDGETIGTGAKIRQREEAL
jgi:hypothetical protein